ncbi:MAG: hypothetical protein DWH97_08500 [Planctomycetota bacterium]|jgi:hypothetical protein|nr:MAG: hypothetical protein DWH97_08500 [Planctomycetota bacterium]RLS92145.1 MAG: hypothetical protein DWI12_11840 [Planctomycetota bacterium]
MNSSSTSRTISRENLRATLRSSAAFLLLMASVLVCGGWNAWTYGGSIVVWPNARCVRYLMPSSFPAGAAHTQQFIGAMSDWSSIDGCAFDFFYQILPQDYDVDHFDGYSDTLAVAPEELDPGVLAVTYTVNSGAQWYDMDIEFNDEPLGVGWNFILNPTCMEEANPGLNGFSFALVAMHECGHSIGLAHEPTGTEPAGNAWIVCTMNPFYVHGGSNGSLRIYELHADDRAGARALYPAATATLVDLATLNFSWTPAYVGVPFTVFMSPSSIRPGEDLTIRSAIENLGAADAFGATQKFWLSTDESLDANDMLLESVVWDIEGGNLYDFDLTVTLPFDMPTGPRYAITMLDAYNTVVEQYEDNNDAVYCVPVQIAQYAPQIVTPLGQFFATAGQSWQSPAPQVTRPLNMAPLQWTLAGNVPAGMTINSSTGIISWPNTVASTFQYIINVRANNGTGSDTQTLYLGVSGTNCPADINHDGKVDGQDLVVVLNAWGSNSAVADLSHNGVVDASDLLLLLGSWGTCLP